MERFKRLALLSLTLFIFLIPSVLAERSEEFEKLLQWYKKNYDFISMDDTVYTFESEFNFPEGYYPPDSKKLSNYSNWISHFPLWHRWKPVGIWKGYKYLEYDQISRAVHLPWKSKVFRDFAIPVRILGEFLHSTNQEFSLKLPPTAGELLTYKKWLQGKPSYATGKKVIFKPSEKRDASIEEYYKYLNFCMQNVNYKNLAAGCDTLSDKEVVPGDMLIAYDESGKNGYVYIILNMIVNKEQDKLYAVATGCKEACDFHIPLVNVDRDSPWLSLERMKGLVKNMAFSGIFRFKVIKDIK